MLGVYECVGDDGISNTLGSEATDNLIHFRQNVWEISELKRTSLFGVAISSTILNCPT